LKIELRNVKYFAAGSEETSCFTATVYVDGKKAGTAQNHGTGGPTMVHPFTIEKQINDYAATLPKASSPMGDGTVFEYSQTAETLIGDLLTEYLIGKDLRSALSKRILFTKKNEKGIFQTKPMPADSRSLLLARPDIQAQRGMNVILNALPFAEALVIYKANGQ
jgi:hypothetical protein